MNRNEGKGPAPACGSDSAVQAEAIGVISKIGIIGLGLIGGSLARAFRKKSKIDRIVAVDTDREAGARAMAEGVIDAFSTPSEGYGILNGSDLLLICTPFQTISRFLPEVSKLNVGIISDVSSIKKPVMDLIRLPNFIGGHPMAGSERTGYSCSNASLFENALYVLCIGDGSSVKETEIKAFEDLIRSIGAAPVRMPAEEHDRRVAVISHLPHVAASALSLLASRQNDAQMAALAAGGFRDITRIASADPSLWAGITEASSPALVPVLEKYIELLEQVKSQLKNHETRGVESFFSESAHYRNHLPTDGRGALEPNASLTVYLEDKPGALASITTLLGAKSINIRNINIRNYRTYEGGQLHLLLGNSEEAQTASMLLKEAGYECE
jgi:prephenate dehydrogenase